MLKKLASPRGKRSSQASNAEAKKLSALDAVPSDKGADHERKPTTEDDESSKQTEDATSVLQGDKRRLHREERRKSVFDDNLVSETRASKKKSMNSPEKSKRGSGILKSLRRDTAHDKASPRTLQDSKDVSASADLSTKDAAEQLVQKRDNNDQSPDAITGEIQMSSRKFKAREKRTGEQKQTVDVIQEEKGSNNDPHMPSSHREDSRTSKSGKHKSKFQKREKHVDPISDENELLHSRNSSKVQRESKDSQQTATSNILSPLRRQKSTFDDNSQNEKPGVATDIAAKRRIPIRYASPSQQPEVHVIGEIVSGHDFGSGGFTCKWSVEYGKLWQHITGDQLGQSQIDYPSSSSKPIVWSHPIDLHFATSTFQGWPKLIFQVWRVDNHMSTNVVGYGFIHLPFSSGEHHLRVPLWRPMGTTKEELEAQFLGRTPELVSDDVIFNSAWAERCRLRTIATGEIFLHVGIILRNFDTHSLQM